MIPNSLRVYRIEGGIVFPDRMSGGVGSKLDDLVPCWLLQANGVKGQARKVVDEALCSPGAIKGDRWDNRRTSALKKLFLDRQGWETVSRPFDRDGFLAAINTQLLIPVGSIDEAMSLDALTLTSAAKDLGFDCLGDLRQSIDGQIERQTLNEVVPVDVQSLIAEYDLCQLRAALFNCTKASIQLTADYSRAIKLARLSGFQTRNVETAEGYRIDLLRTTHFLGGFDFGRGVSKMASSLVRLKGWSLEGKFKDHVFQGEIKVTAASGYKSSKPPYPLFDSKVEEMFWSDWHLCSRSGWTLHREPRLLVNGETVFCPDFEARKGPHRVLVEIVGKNDPTYAIPKAASLEKFDLSGAILLVKKEIAHLFSQLSATLITHSNQPSADKVVEALESIHGACSVAHRER